MAKFIDTHPMRPLDGETLRNQQRATEDEFGITHHDILFNESEIGAYWVLSAPDANAGRRYHEQARDRLRLNF